MNYLAEASLFGWRVSRDDLPLCSLTGLVVGPLTSVAGSARFNTVGDTSQYQYLGEQCPGSKYLGCPTDLIVRAEVLHREPKTSSGSVQMRSRPQYAPSLPAWQRLCSLRVSALVTSQPDISAIPPPLTVTTK
jgi:hypothetical protein